MTRSEVQVPHRPPVQGMLFCLELSYLGGIPILEWTDLPWRTGTDTTGCRRFIILTEEGACLERGWKGTEMFRVRIVDYF